MLTWNTFLERKGCDMSGMEKKLGKKHIEDMEEKLGQDLDNDNEEGESAAHKKKVLGKAEKED